MTEYTILLIWDDETRVWITESEDISGLILEAKSVDALIKEVKLAAPELLELMNIPFHDIKLDFKAERRMVVA
jgi:predicted RNase H-like HicB family nuclease